MKFFKILKKGWMKFAHIIGTVNTFLLLFIIYVFGFGIYAILFKPFKWANALFKKNPDSYWSEYEKNEEYNYPF